MTAPDALIDILRDLVIDVDAMGGIRLDKRGRVAGLTEEIDTRSWANLAIIVKAAADLLAASGKAEPLSEHRDQEWE